MSGLMHDTPTDHRTDTPAGGDELARRPAIRQINRRRRFWISTVSLTVGMAILVIIWAVTEYHNAGGWPVHGFSQSSGLYEVWNLWIIYPLGACLLVVAAHAWAVFGIKPISEGEINREIERQRGIRL